MTKKKVCKKCKLFVEENVCPICKGNLFSHNWQGKIVISDASRSMVAEKIGIKVKGEYALKVK